MEHPADRPYHVQEVCTILGMSPDAVWRMCRTGTLPAVKLGKTWFIKRREFDEMIGRAPSSGSDRPKRKRRGPKGPALDTPLWP